MTMFSKAACGAWLLFLCLFAAGSLAAQTEYQSAEEAWRVGLAFYNSRNFAASREPLEAALKLAPDDKFRSKVYEALTAAYRLLPETDKMLTACDFVITRSDSEPKRSLMRRSLLAFFFQRGKIDELARHYEEALEQDEKNRTALFVLSELYGSVKRDAGRAAELTERLAKLDDAAGGPVNVPRSAELARQYVQSKQFQAGAELYEKIAPLDEKLAAWHWKEAAAAWLRAGEKAKALAAAQRADKYPPEARSDLLAHFWHRGLADVYLAAGQPKPAIGHYEQAIAKTTIEGYLTACEKSLAEARAKAAQQ